MKTDTCPKCAGGLRTQQVANVISKYCDRCGPLPNGWNVKTGKPARVGR